MATNPPTGDGHRKGAVRDRSQTLNPKTEQWIKRDDDTGRFNGREARRKAVQRRPQGTVTSHSSRHPRTRERSDVRSRIQR